MMLATLIADAAAFRHMFTIAPGTQHHNNTWQRRHVLRCRYYYVTPVFRCRALDAADYMPLLMLRGLFAALRRRRLRRHYGML